MTVNDFIDEPDPEPLLSEDQQRACDWLIALASVRAGTSRVALPVRSLARWSVPLLVGRAGSGKEFVCRQVARRLGDWPCRRWDVRPWITMAIRASDTTLEQMVAFIGANPGGCVVYLAGVDSLAGVMERNEHYTQAVAGELARFLGEAAARPVRFTQRGGGVVHGNVLVVAGGSFPGMWEEVEVGGAEVWRFDGGGQGADPGTVARWMGERSRLPAEILRRLSAEPLVLGELDDVQAGKLAMRLRDNLPPALDGLGADELCAALQSPQGWGAVATLIERVWVECHETLPLLSASVEAPVPKVVLLDLAEDDAPHGRAIRLGDRLGIPSRLAPVVSKARRLGLKTVGRLTELAVARGYLLPGEQAKMMIATERVERVRFSDAELAAALLSPCLQWSERAICRGAGVLAKQIALRDSSHLLHDIRQARAERVVRHVARLALEAEPENRDWRALEFAYLDGAEFRAGVMPDEAIRRVLAVTQRG